MKDGIRQFYVKPKFDLTSVNLTCFDVLTDSVKLTSPKNVKMRQNTSKSVKNSHILSSCDQMLVIIIENEPKIFAKCDRLPHMSVTLLDAFVTSF